MEFVKELNYPPNFVEFRDYFLENQPKGNREERRSDEPDSFEGIASNTEKSIERREEDEKKQPIKMSIRCTNHWY